MAEKNRKSLKEVIYDDLKEKIVFCELLPGTPISEDEIGKEYQVSRRPVREAILQLTRENYITIEARKSTKVSKISLQEMNEIIESRLLIEPYIIRTQNDLLGPEMIQKLEEIMYKFDEISLDDEKSLRKFLNIDYEFHSLLVGLSNNQLLINFCKDILQRSIRQWYLMYMRMEGRLSTAKNEHKEIIGLLAKGEFTNAARNLEQHIKAFYDLIYYN